MTIRVISRLLFAAYFIEAGLILVFAPWSLFWDHNVFAATRPALRALLSSPYTRGAVSGIGVVTIVAGLVELAAAIASRRQPESPPRETQG